MPSFAPHAKAARQPAPATARARPRFEQGRETIDLAGQRAIGNQAVQRSLQDNLADHDAASTTTPPSEAAHHQEPDRVRTYTTTSTYRLVARIRQAARRGSMAGIPAHGQLAHGRETDAAEKGQEQRATVSEDGGAITVEESDSIGSALAYRPSVAGDPSPPGPDEYGVTRTTPRVSDIAVAHDSAAAAFNVTGNVVNTVTWSVHSRGRTDIPDENAAAITGANYATVASDLTPDVSSDNGRPPRTRFWARDLTERHELFHANERAFAYGQPAFDLARNWLVAQAATDEVGVRVLVNRIPGRMFDSYNASYVPGKESRAYGDGAPLYRARADAITAKGARGGYGGLSKGAKAAIGIGGGALLGAGIGAWVGGPVGAGVGAVAGAIIGGLGSLLF